MSKPVDQIDVVYVCVCVCVCVAGCGSIFGAEGRGTLAKASAYDTVCVCVLMKCIW